MRPPALNREDWLTRLVEDLRPWIQTVGYGIPEVKISCGWPSTRALSTKRRRIAECWNYKASEDGLPQIFVSPVLSLPLEVAETVVHELGHAALPDAGHKGPFRAFMRATGLTGKPTATIAGPALADRLVEITSTLGAYPNGRLDKLQRPEKKQSTRMHKLICENPEEHKEPYILRGSKKAIELGLPLCPCGKEMIADEPENPDDDN